MLTIYIRLPTVSQVLDKFLLCECITNYNFAIYEILILSKASLYINGAKISTDQAKKDFFVF